MSIARARTVRGALRIAPSGLARWQASQDWLLLSPALVFLAVFKLIPVAAVAYLALTRWRILGWPRFVGLENFHAMWQDPVFLTAFKNTLYYVAVIVPSLTAGSLGVALLTEALGRGRHLFRLTYFLPIVVPFSLIATMWKSAIYSPFGLVNQLLVASGLERVNFLGAEHARLSISVVIVWAQVGLFSLMFSAGLKAIPEEVREAAAIDGASGWVRFWRITLPLLNPTLLLVVIVSTVAAFRAFDVVHVLTGGGPSYASTSLLVYVYEVGWKRFQMGYAAALALVFCAVAVTLNLLQRLALGESKHE